MVRSQDSLLLLQIPGTEMVKDQKNVKKGRYFTKVEISKHR